MATPNNPKFKGGEQVKILTSNIGFVGKIVELRGPLGPKGAEVYRIRIKRKPKPLYVEVLEDELELVQGE